MAFIRETNQEKINFIIDISLSQQHILTGSSTGDRNYREAPSCYWSIREIWV